MSQTMNPSIHSSIPAFLSGGGEMGTNIRSYNWEKTPLGSVEAWPQSLRSVVSICLNSNFPIAVYWGKELTLLYNDAWSPIPGNKHPWALGKTAREVWPEIWNDIEPQFQKAFGGEPGGSKDALLPMQRHGYTEECYFNFTFTPIYGETGKIEGIFNAVIETTYRVINERRTSFVKSLALSLASALTKEALLAQLISCLQQAPQDVVFASIYEAKEPHNLIASTLPSEDRERQKKLWPLAGVRQSGKPLLVENLADYFVQLPAGYWPEEPAQAYLLPLTGGNGNDIGILVMALSARRRFDEDYRIYLETICSTVVTAYNVIAALEEERSKAQALAEIDKAKTAFFSNISHEFRTPLTLILGSLETLLKNQEEDFGADSRTVIETTHRNSLRLLRLVNNLLDFSRIEAGKTKARFELTDIAAATREIAGSFQSAIENAGLQFMVDCTAITQPVYVDRGMWEKVVLNLLSNAFKYTLKGSIHVSVSAKGNLVVLQVKDTGVGIPAKELPRMFERFHRIENSGGRTYEGTGIGLSLVQELIKLHGGAIAVESEEGKGSVFTVSLPTGKAHLPQDQIFENGNTYDTSFTDWFVSEAAALIKNEGENEAGTSTGEQAKKPLLLVVDDNADMRNYFTAVIQPEYHLLTAANGSEALPLLSKQTPDLIISDIMMPVMDGIALLKAVKENTATGSVPVILVSARAGEDERIEGYELGADDYLVKPFSAKELLTRVRSQISIAQKRNKALQEVYDVFDAVPFAVLVLRGPDFTIEFINQYNLSVWGQAKEDVLGKSLREARPDIWSSAADLHEGIYKTGKRFASGEVPVTMQTNGVVETRYFNAVIDPLYNETGQLTGQLAASFDVTEQVVNRRRLEESEKALRITKEQLEVTIENVPADVYISDHSGKMVYANKPAHQKLRQILDDNFDAADSLPAMIEKATEKILYLDENNQPLAAEDYPPYIAMQTGRQSQLFIQRRYLKSNKTEWFLNTSVPLLDAEGKVEYIISTSVDFTPQKEAENKIRESEKRFRTLADTLPQMVWMRDMNGNMEYGSKYWHLYSGIDNVSEAWKAMVHPDDWQPVMQNWERHFNNGTPFTYEVRLKNKEDYYRWHQAFAEPLTDDNGNVVKWIGVVTDIHNQKSFAESLEREVAQRTKELARSNEDLQQFAHVASHDLKEPVRKVMTFASRLKEELGTRASEQAIRFLSKIEASAIRMYSMIDGVLLYSSLNALEQTKELIDLNELIENIKSDLEVPMSEKKAQILNGLLPSIEGSPILIYQLFYNLVNNSLKFAKSDVPPEIQIVQEAVLREDVKMLMPHKKYVKIVIEDNGIGFSNADAERIFATFTRLHSKDLYEGTGLGLSLCRKIVERQGGAIYATGEEGKGAKFSLLLPL